MLKNVRSKKASFRLKVSITMITVVLFSVLLTFSVLASPPNPIEKPGYTLIANDEFNSTTLNENLWFKWYLPHWTTRDKCQANYSLENDAITLKITPEMVPWDPTYDGETVISSIQTGERDWLHKWNSSYPGNNHHEATVQNHLQKYGYFEIRAKTQRGSGIHCAWWMIGFQEDTGDWNNSRQNAEIDIFEILGRNNGDEMLFNLHPWRDTSLGLSSSSTSGYLSFDPSADFHVYGFEWNETNMKLYVDGVLTRTINKSPNYPMMTLMGIYEKRHGGWTGSFDSSVPYPKTFTIDYWRAYQRNDRLGSYEAESGIVNGQTTVINKSVASNGKVVGYLGNSTNNWLDINNVNVDSAGTYNMNVDYFSGENRNLSIRVNNGTPRTLTNMNSGGWSTLGTTTVQVQLNGGINTVSFYNDTGWAPDIDRIKITDAATNLASSASVSATALKATYPVGNVKDANTATNAESVENPSFPQYITFNWSSDQTLSKVKIGTWYGVGQGINNFDIQVSDDGNTNWTNVATAVNPSWQLNDGTVEWREIQFAQVQGKKGLRLKINNANLTWKHYAINEIEIY